MTRIVRTSGEDAPSTLDVEGRLVTDGVGRQVHWNLAEEVPAALLYNGESFAVMMITPEDVEDFAVGFSLTEGVVDRAEDIEAVRIAPLADGYVVNIAVDPARYERARERRRSIPGRAGCGVCGAQTLGAAVPVPPTVSGPWPTAEALARAFRDFPSRQPMNIANRSTHAAAFCRRDGAIDIVREDIGRHNALDKLVGALARADRDASDGFVLLSSRFSVELVYKAAMIRAPFAASISAPTGLALQMAERAGMGIAALDKASSIMFFNAGTGAREGAT